MKIAIITETLSTHSGSRAPIELAKHLSLSNEITLLAYDFNTEKNLKKDLEKRGIKIILITPYPFPFGKLLAVLQSLPHLRTNEIISFHGTLSSFLAAKISGIPIVKTYYGTQLDAYLERFLPNQKIGLKNRLFNWFGNQIILLKEKINFFLATEIIGISKYASNEAKRLYNRKISYIYLGSDLPGSYRPPITNHRSPITTTILSVSRFTPYKGFHQLIEVFKRVSSEIPQAKLVLAGSTSNLNYLSYLRKLSKGSNIQIFTNLSDKKLVHLYHKCDLYATCDQYLFFGLPIIEAAALGKPSIALDFCAAKEIIDHEKTGLLAQNLEEFEQSLIFLIKDKKLRTKLGESAKKKTEKDFVWAKTVKEYEEILKGYAKI